MRISSAHVHSTYCDGKNTVREMIEAAIGNGFTGVGISSHGVQDFDLPYCMPSFEVEKQYKQEVRRLAEVYADKIKVWLGVERDCYSLSDPSGYDYFIASQHYVMFDKTWLPVNADKKEIDYVLEKYCGGDVYKIIEKYFDVFTKYIIEKRPNIVGHFDIIKRLNDSYAYFDMDDLRYIDLAKSAMRKIIGHCDMLEINTSMIERRGVQYMYPSPQLLRFWQNLGGDIIINSDCHYKELMTSGYTMAIEEARKAGFKRMQVLGPDCMFESVDLI